MKILSSQVALLVEARTVTDRKEDARIKEVASLEAADHNKEMVGSPVEAEASLTEAVAMRASIMVIIRPTEEVEVGLFKDGRGEHEVMHPVEEDITLSQVRETHNIKVYHNIITFAEYVATRVTMTINVIPYSIWHMPYKHNSLKTIIILQMRLSRTITILEMTRLFKAGVSKT